LLLASSLLVDPGKHWLLADPGYPCNRHFLRLVEGARSWCRWALRYVIN
jgi:aspartate/methionine/tyrosine aminotransferase